MSSVYNARMSLSFDVIWVYKLISSVYNARISLSLDVIWF